ncbi:MAG: hypothetical protein AAF721_00575 [Myxococcota bacterium]
MLRRIIAAVGHAPALWIVYREPLPPVVRRPNLIAALATLAAMIAGGVLAPAEQRWVTVFWVWLAGHFLWGAYLFAKLPPPLSRD